MKDRALIRGKYDAGRYIVAGDEPCAESLRDWITGRGFEQYERQALRFDHHGRARNRLYSFHLPEAECEVVMKTCQVLGNYKWPRRFELAVRQRIKDYNKTAFIGCRMMRLAGIPAARPLAFWNARQGFLDQTSYFLYQKIQFNRSLSDLCQTIRRMEHDDTPGLIEAAKHKAIGIVRAMHDAGLRHNDPHGQNFLIGIPETTRLSPAGIEQATYCLIDYDHCARATIRIPMIKKFFDLRELRRTCIEDSGPHQLLDIYLDGQKSPLAHAVLEFWRRGGFNPLHWLFPQHRKKRGRHLKS